MLIKTANRIPRTRGSQYRSRFARWVMVVPSGTAQVPLLADLYLYV